MNVTHHFIITVSMPDTISRANVANAIGKALTGLLARIIPGCEVTQVIPTGIRFAGK